MTTTPIITATGWVETARAEFDCPTPPCPPPVGSITGQFIVPLDPLVPPVTGSVQFFIGAQPNDATSIMQTVLQFDRTWTVFIEQNFGPGKTPQQNSSPPIDANAGDTIKTSMTTVLTADPQMLICTVEATNQRTGRSTRFAGLITSPLAQVYGGALEVHGITDCRQLPPDGSIAFTNLTMKDASGNVLSPSRWVQRKYDVGLKCNFAVEAAGDTVKLSW